MTEYELIDWAMQQGARFARALRSERGHSRWHECPYRSKRYMRWWVAGFCAVQAFQDGMYRLDILHTLDRKIAESERSAIQQDQA